MDIGHEEIDDPYILFALYLSLKDRRMTLAGVTSAPPKLATAGQFQMTSRFLLLYWF